MFQQACNLIRPSLCVVGNGSTILGTGFHVSPTIVITANHFFPAQGGSPTILNDSGVFQCSFHHQSPDRDIAILSVGGQISPQGDPQSHPMTLTCVASFPQQGMTVGYMSILRKHDQGRDRRYNVFFDGAFTHEIGNGPQHSQWVINNGLMEEGFSGSPVFLPTGEIVGVIVRATQVMTFVNDPVLQPVLSTFPVASSIYPILNFLPVP